MLAFGNALAKRATRRFLSGYLEYSYGRRDATDIPASAMQLRAQLAAQPPRVPPGVRKRHARVVVLQANGAGPVRAAMIALVDDGHGTYSINLRLEHGRSGWQVTAVG